MVFIVVGGISIVANTVIKNSFTNYVIQLQEKQTSDLIKSIEMKYEEENAFNQDYLAILGMNALENGTIIEIFNNDKNTIWSAYQHNNGMCQAMISDMISNMYSYSGNWKGHFEEKSYPIMVHKIQVGTITTGFIGPYYFNDEELIFIQALNKLFIIMGICSLILAVGLGIIMSLKISNPLNKIAKKALLLSEGNYKERIENNSNTKEISILTDTINNLSEALENKEVLRKQLTQDVAHELRTPITSVQGHMEAMIDGIWPMNVERLTSCYEEILRIKRLIGGIEVISSLENENIIIRKEEFDLSKLIDRLVQNFEKDFLSKNLTCNYHSKNVKIHGDEDKMSQVFNNLISNAIKYTKEGDEIFLDIKTLPKHIEISVKDTGIGIEASDLEHIFERFYRADKSRNSETGGMGVGLTITKKIIEGHGGTIRAESILGKGTEFIIQLPK